MPELSTGIRGHRMQARDLASVLAGQVRYAPAKSLWFSIMALTTLIAGPLTVSWGALALFVVATGTVLLFGHSLGSHRKLIHDSFQCPRWLERLLVWLGVQVGLAGPLGLLRQHELRDYAQRLPDCHPYLRHGSSFWRDAWWQLHCELHLDRAPELQLEPRIADSAFLRGLERTWMIQQLPLAFVFYLWGGWGFVVWGVCARITAGVLGHWLIGYFAHNHGGMHYEVQGAAVQGRNIRFTSLLTMGECWHNNHHAFPGSARLGLFAGEWDPGWWALMLLRKVGWVWGLRLPPAMAHRPELRACDAHTVDGLPAGGAKIVPPSWRDLVQLWRPTARVALLEGPAALLSGPLLQRIAGSRTPVRVDPTLARLTLRLEGEVTVVQGLPAFCLALVRRGGVERLVGIAMAPLAIQIERARQSLDMA